MAPASLRPHGRLSAFIIYCVVHKPSYCSYCCYTIHDVRASRVLSSVDSMAPYHQEGHEKLHAPRNKNSASKMQLTRVKQATAQQQHDTYPSTPSPRNPSTKPPPNPPFDNDPKHKYYRHGETRKRANHHHRYRAMTTWRWIRSNITWYY